MTSWEEWPFPRIKFMECLAARLRYSRVEGGTGYLSAFISASLVLLDVIWDLFKLCLLSFVMHCCAQVYYIRRRSTLSSIGMLCGNKGNYMWMDFTNSRMTHLTSDFPIFEKVYKLSKWFQYRGTQYAFAAICNCLKKYGILLACFWHKSFI